ncbi:hypothetical protein C5167_026668 [Papaver somniferum]|nr:hypothetical protein C5167_026668 [Papaver somniferum]
MVFSLALNPSLVYINYSHLKFKRKSAIKAEFAGEKDIRGERDAPIDTNKIAHKVLDENPESRKKGTWGL